MEQSGYVDRTLAIYTRARRKGANVGVCIQSYLRRTEDDLRSLLPLGGAIRLVKGAYNEPADVAFPKKSEVDENYYRLAQTLLGQDARFEGIRAAIATHDRALIQRIIGFATANQFPKNELEFQMLYGIQRGRTTTSGRRRLSLDCIGGLWRLLVSLVHAPPGRAAGQCFVPAPQSLFRVIGSAGVPAGIRRATIHLQGQTPAEENANHQCRFRFCAARGVRAN